MQGRLSQLFKANKTAQQNAEKKEAQPQPSHAAKSGSKKEPEFYDVDLNSSSHETNKKLEKIPLQQVADVDEFQCICFPFFRP